MSNRAGCEGATPNVRPETFPPKEERFGVRTLRVDVPTLGVDCRPATWLTHWYGGAALFAVTLTDEVTALRANRPYEPAGRYLPPPDDDGDDDTGGSD
jgi:hypothetical protein